MIHNKDNINQTFMDPTPKLPPNPFINIYSEKYYNMRKQKFHTLRHYNGKLPSLYRNIQEGVCIHERELKSSHGVI